MKIRIRVVSESRERQDGSPGRVRMELRVKVRVKISLRVRCEVRSVLVVRFILGIG